MVVTVCVCLTKQLVDPPAWFVPGCGWLSVFIVGPQMRRFRAVRSAVHTPPERRFVFVSGTGEALRSGVESVVSGFLNRVHKFDSCRGHHHQLEPRAIVAPLSPTICRAFLHKPAWAASAAMGRPCCASGRRRHRQHGRPARKPRPAGRGSDRGGDVRATAGRRRRRGTARVADQGQGRRRHGIRPARAALARRIPLCGTAS